MLITALAGGVGSARFLAGLVRVVDPASLVAVVNTGDDERIRGLHVSPDVDTVLYHLAGAADWLRGWGVRDETFAVQRRYEALASSVAGADTQDWFSLGDRDLATHLLRTRLLDTGWRLSRAIDALRRAMGIECTVLPMSDDVVRTRLQIASGELLDFQDYFVRRRCEDEVVNVVFDGATDAVPAPGLLDALAGADVILIPPSNPLVSVEPVLGVPGVRRAVTEATARRIAISPIVAGEAVKGPAGALLASMGHEASALGVARIYTGLVGEFVLDEADAGLAPAVESLGMRAIVCDTIMRSPEDAARLAKAVLEG